MWGTHGGKLGILFGIGLGLRRIPGRPTFLANQENVKTKSNFGRIWANFRLMGNLKPSKGGPNFWPNFYPQIWPNFWRADPTKILVTLTLFLKISTNLPQIGRRSRGSGATAGVCRAEFGENVGRVPPYDFT